MTTNRPHNKNPKSILIYRQDKLGDAVVSSHFIKAFKIKYPEAKITVGLPTFAHNAYSKAPYIDDIIDASKVPEQGKHYDWAISLETPTKHIKQLYHIDANRTFIRYYYHRILTILTIRFFITDPIFIPQKILKLSLHECQYYAYMASKMGVNVDLSEPYPIGINKKEREQGKKISQNINSEAQILFHCGIRWLEKGWKEQDLIQLIQTLSTKYSLLCTYGPAEEKMVESIKPSLPGVSFIGGLTLQEWAGIMEHLPLIVSCDTGAIHLGSSTKTPIIASFTDNSYRKTMQQWRPLYSPTFCLLRSSPAGHINALSTAVDNFFHHNGSLFNTKIPNTNFIRK